MSDHNIGAQQEAQQQPGVTVVDVNGQQDATTLVGHNTRPQVLPQRPTDAPNFLLHNMPQYLPTITGPPYTSTMPPAQLGKLTLEPFTGDITQFHRFWCTFKLAVHNNPYTPPVYKFLYLQNLLKGEAQVVLQDLGPDGCNYDQLVAALEKRRDHHELLCSEREYTHRQLSQDRRSDGRHLHRSPYRYQSRSPPREHRSDRDSSRSDRSQSQLRSRYQWRRDSHSSYSSRSQSPQRVKFHAPVRDHSGYHKRRSSPYPQQNQVLKSDDEANEPFSCYTSVSSNNSVSPPRSPASLMLVKGKAFNHMSSAMEQVVLFLDSGAHKSFIASSTAHRLGLSIRDSHPRTFVTFGGHPTTEVSGTAQLTLIDLQGEQFTLELTTKQTITLPQFPPRLSSEDVEFIQHHELPLPLCSSKSAVPDILIGIDHYWDILSSEFPICLSSGIVLCHTRLGAVVSDNSVFRLGYQRAHTPRISSQPANTTTTVQSSAYGPTLVPELVGILLRARLHPFLFIADVGKAFHQIRLQHSQRDARFLWLKDTSKPPAENLRIFRFTRIPFGVNASPLLLAAAIKLYLHREKCPVGDEISRNTYVDIVIPAASSRREAFKKYELAKSIFTRMHMNLREFLCNSTYVNSRTASRDRAINPSGASLLGIRWDFENDSLTIRLKIACSQVDTKRNALSALAATYDPLGLLTPFLDPAKIFI
ncbi:hypothetical protein GCK32_004857 [Trichostrongylus colubriformis]|uniref:Uncharacterized protein n=1 Tax=Trichostrongylus colubriformis TaxID=6319 RepID=A0AAN8F7W9_TRICO